jgi:hypothetical protein
MKNMNDLGHGQASLPKMILAVGPGMGRRPFRGIHVREVAEEGVGSEGLGLGQLTVAVFEDPRSPAVEEDGYDVRFLSVPYIFPRPDLTEEIEAAEDVIVVECNATGQFADVIEHDVLERVQRINKYNGVRFKADELATEIKQTLDTPAEATQ